MLVELNMIESSALIGNGSGCLPLISSSEVAKIVFALLFYSLTTISIGLIPVFSSSESSAASSISGSGRLGSKSYFLLPF